jgi:hypothetical protein
MRALIFAALLGLTLIFSLASAVFGVFIMFSSITNSSADLMQGFTIFCLGTILFFVTSIAYIVTKILTNTDVLTDVLTKMLLREQNNAQPVNPFQALFGHGGMGTIKVAGVDENGNITPMGESQFNSTEDLLKQRNDILAKAFGWKPETSKKKFEDMTMTELESEEKKAVDGQQFELAAALRDLIEQRKKES